MTTPPPSTADELDTAALVELARRSHQVIVEHQHSSGAYPAAPWFSAYTGFAWLRDGSFTAEGVSRHGDATSAGRFHDWTAEVLAARRGQVDALASSARKGEEVPVQQMLPTRFTLDGADGSADWWDFQTDGYGTWLWSLTAYASRHGADLERWRDGVHTCVDYLVAFWNRACYDWWEEHVEQRHVSTLGAIYGGLTAIGGAGLLDESRRAVALEAAEAARTLVLEAGVQDGHLTKWLGTAAVDGSLPSCVVPFGLLRVDDPLAAGTLDVVGRDLDVDGGVHRFRSDVFYGGGQWPILSALLAWNRAAAGDLRSAREHLRWIAAQATPAGELPEQVDHHLLAPEHRAEWIDRWGPVATPLLWSHGMYLILAHELGIIDGAAP